MTDHEVGRLSAQVEASDARIEKLEAKVDEILRILNEAKGGWRMLLMVGGAVGVVMAFTLKILGAFVGSKT